MQKSLIIFDLNRTLFDPERDDLMPRAIDVLRACVERGYTLALVSRHEPMRDSIIDRYDLRPWFAYIHLVDEKTVELFREIIKKTQSSPVKSFAIGDVVSKEIAIGNACGMQTIWLRAGKFKDMVPTTSIEEPTVTIGHLWECLDFIPVADAA